MEEEVKAGIEKFQAKCADLLPGCRVVIPVRPTGGAFLISLSHQEIRTYGTIHEDDFADWGENLNLNTLQTAVKDLIKKLQTHPE